MRSGVGSWGGRRCVRPSSVLGKRVTPVQPFRVIPVKTIKARRVPVLTRRYRRVSPGFRLPRRNRGSNSRFTFKLPFLIDRRGHRLKMLPPFGGIRFMILSPWRSGQSFTIRVILTVRRWVIKTGWTLRATVVTAVFIVPRFSPGLTRFVPGFSFS